MLVDEQVGYSQRVCVVVRQDPGGIPSILVGKQVASGVSAFEGPAFV